VLKDTQISTLSLADNRLDDDAKKLLQEAAAGRVELNLYYPR